MTTPCPFVDKLHVTISRDKQVVLIDLQFKDSIIGTFCITYNSWLELTSEMPQRLEEKFLEMESKGASVQ